MADERLKKYVKKLIVRDVASDEVICNKCHTKYYRWTQSELKKTRQLLPNVDEKTPEQLPAESPKSIKLNINTACKSHKYCFIRKGQPDIN